ncbi:Uncharacterized protein HZ326_9707 [Fusarium oxysporum f. sp. albedinis]|nr:Uncharacterized protein HZ326_9707 [Fusarium oxysporum f. sp. albedinis]
MNSELKSWTECKLCIAECYVHVAKLFSPSNVPCPIPKARGSRVTVTDTKSHEMRNYLLIKRHGRNNGRGVGTRFEK